ncbi:MAG: hypothetical protein QOF49_1222 [Chloroflexota bacterium]|jgi:hypothetical protein|nr:hypothetical protein [Chloroflexota bacterium]
MFHSETLARVIHADRVRDLERTSTERRLLTAADPIGNGRREPATRRGVEPSRPIARDGSAGVTA